MLKNKNKMSYIFTIILLLCIFVGIFFEFSFEPIILNYLSNDKRKDKNKLRLVQYNTDFLFSDSKIIECPGKDCDWKNKEQEDKHFKKISNIIDILNPDIINLCEINTIKILNKLKQDLNHDRYKCYLSKSEPNYIDQNLGIITNIEPLSFYRTNDKIHYPISFSDCDCIEAGITNLPKHYISTFYINNMNILMIGLHLLAYPNYPERCAMREAGAIIIQKIILDYYHNHEIIIIGDLNDYDNDVLDHTNNKSKSKVLDIIKGNRGYNPIDYKLYNVSEYIIKKNRKTNIRDNSSMSMLDHILVTEKLTKYIKDVYVFTHYNGKIGENFNSDHYPLVVDFDFTSADDKPEI
uniref:Endonuclease/exonuclease/phosphatase domain-containing protein n=1 Tax=viral metagenome TaxID=1070528 RepID=A0A6C0HX54_9ZZZZ